MQSGPGGPISERGCWDHLPLQPVGEDGQGASQSLMSVRIYTSTASVLEIPAGGLQAGDIYVFSLSVAKEKREAGSTSVRITGERCCCAVCSCPTHGLPANMMALITSQLRLNAALAGNPPTVSILDAPSGKVNPAKRQVGGRAVPRPSPLIAVSLARVE